MKRITRIVAIAGVFIPLVLAVPVLAKAPAIPVPTQATSDGGTVFAATGPAQDAAPRTASLPLVKISGTPANFAPNHITVPAKWVVGEPCTPSLTSWNILNSTSSTQTVSGKGDDFTPIPSGETEGVCVGTSHRGRTDTLYLASNTAAVLHMTIPGNATCGDPKTNFGTQLLGNSWPGGFTGVPVYSNGSSSFVGTCNSSATTPAGNVVTTGTEWQCVELVNRLYATAGWISSTWAGNGGRSPSARDSMFDLAPANLQKEAEGSITYVSPGDVVSVNVKDGRIFEPDGHVLIVSAVTGSDVTYVSQNAGTNTVSTVTTTGQLESDGDLTVKASGKWTYPVIGVVHAPTAGSRPSSPALNESTNLSTVFGEGPSNRLNLFDDTSVRGIIVGIRRTQRGDTH
jgi:hypothetical protein